jgi:hypothetical protein
VKECRHVVSAESPAFSLNPKEVKLDECADSTPDLPILHAEAESKALLPGPYFAVFFEAWIARNFIDQFCY